jgi:hypothetical protein
VHVLLLIASPLIALAFSCPIPEKALRVWRSSVPAQ